MRLAHILVCHSVQPTKLFQSIPHEEDAKWYVFLHSEDKDVAATVSSLAAERDGNVFTYETNRGLAKSWNDGIHLALEAGCEAILLLNDDLFFYENGYIQFKKTIELVTKQQKNISFISLNGLETGSSSHAGQVMVQNFACCALTRNVVERIGYFDQNFSPAYFEDVDYARRAALAGLVPFVDERTLVEHERSSTTRLASPGHQAAMSKMFRNNKEYYERKWGGPMTEPTFTLPFQNQKFGLKITFSQRATPYEGSFDMPSEEELKTKHSMTGGLTMSTDELARIATAHQTDK